MGIGIGMRMRMGMRTRGGESLLPIGCVSRRRGLGHAVWELWEVVVCDTWPPCLRLLLVSPGSMRIWKKALSKCPAAIKASIPTRWRRTSRAPLSSSPCGPARLAAVFSVLACLALPCQVQQTTQGQASAGERGKCGQPCQHPPYHRYQPHPAVGSVRNTVPSVRASGALGGLQRSK